GTRVSRCGSGVAFASSIASRDEMNRSAVPCTYATGTDTRAASSTGGDGFVHRAATRTPHIRAVALRPIHVRVMVAPRIPRTLRGRRQAAGHETMTAPAISVSVTA